jgi:hypothetical protein
MAANGWCRTMSMTDPNGWRPIAEAPRDGTVLLLYLAVKADRQWIVADDAPFYALGFWRHGRWQSVEVEDCGSMGGELTGWMPDWVSLDLQPTYWQSLPAPPALEEGE